LRDQLYPVKVDNVNRMAVLDHDGKVLLGAAEVLGEENEAQNWVAQQDISQFFMYSGDRLGRGILTGGEL
jgi:hypothetical protein